MIYFIHIMSTFHLSHNNPLRARFGLIGGTVCPPFFVDNDLTIAACADDPAGLSTPINRVDGSFVPSGELRFLQPFFFDTSSSDDTWHALSAKCLGVFLWFSSPDADRSVV